ncbi:polysaccharide deacetylase family protein [Parapedobacter deserti]|uniref:Polysaccharide deacetylase family protein n=1 Tax=Parapedobacter deserti TaxID=1912957 RepID=A0ABV7JJT9_9SPHI
MIIIETSKTCVPEKNYVFEVVLSEFLGLDYTVRFDDSISDKTTISIDAPGPRKDIELNDTFFRNASVKWLSDDTLPKMPLKVLHLNRTFLTESLPFSDINVLFGEAYIVRNDESNISCGIDLFGSIFFMLSRYEEMVVDDRDSHDRFPSKSSVAYKASFLTRPIVNEYVEILWQLISDPNSRLSRKKQSFRITLTCDVDWPFNPINENYRLLARKITSNLINSLDFRTSVRNVKEFFNVKKHGWRADSHNTFNYLMRLAEKNNTGMAFYFICDHTAGQIDGNYTLDNPMIEKLMLDIHHRGHEIGLHSSYNTYLNQKQTQKEATILTDKLQRLDIKQSHIGVRQHYLRYRTPETITHLDSANLQYDSTLSYADHVGFRCGTCYEYTMYDLKNRAKLKIKERPLIAMETTVISSNYMNLGYTGEAIKTFKHLMKQCYFYKGNFILLWHNSFFHDQRCFNILEEIVSERF